MENYHTITKAEEIYLEVLSSRISEMEAFRPWYNDILWSGKELSFEQIVKNNRPYSWWRTNCKEVAEEATQKFQEWLQTSSSSSAFTKIDEKGRLYEPFTVSLEQRHQWYWFATYTNPVTNEKITRGPYKTGQLEFPQLNNDNRPEDTLFFEDVEGDVQGRVFAAPVAC